MLETEPVLENEILLGIENVIITPHVGSRTLENIEKQAILSIKNLINELH